MAQKSSTQIAKDARSLSEDLVALRLELHALAKKDSRFDKAIDLDNVINSSINTLKDLNRIILKYGNF